MLLEEVAKENCVCSLTGSLLTRQSVLVNMDVIDYIFHQKQLVIKFRIEEDHDRLTNLGAKRIHLLSPSISAKDKR